MVKYGGQSGHPGVTAMDSSDAGKRVWKHS